MKRIFLAYNKEEEQVAKHILDAIEKLSMNVQCSEWSTGQRTLVWSGVQETIQQSDYIIAVLGAADSGSPWLNQVVGFAEAYGKTVIPVVQKDVHWTPLNVSTRLVYFDLHEPAKAAEIIVSIIETSEKKQATQYGQVSKAKPKKVLILEDNSDWRHRLSRILMEEFKVLTANTTEKAINILSRQDVSVAVLDVRLNDWDEVDMRGLEVAEYITSKGLLTKTIIMTGYPDSETIKKAFQTGNVVDFLVKSEYTDDRIKRYVRKAAELVIG